MMLFSEKTQLNRIIPKAKFMKLAGLSTAVRKEFQNNVDRLILANILRKDTVNINPGKNVNEIDVFEILLNEKIISDKLIQEIDSSIPKHILYVFKFKNELQFAISYKEKQASGDKYRVVRIYRSSWINIDEASLELNGLELDTVFNNFISQISNGKIEINENIEISEAVEKSVEIERLERQIEQLKSKIRKEVQFNKQIELKNDLKILINKLKQLEK